jgi:hypothetical protein
MSPFFEPAEGALPPDQIRFTALSVEPYDDGRRVRVHFSLTPFEQPPNITLLLLDPSGEEVSRASIIESIDTTLAFTMHIRVPSTALEYCLTAALGYPDQEPVDNRSLNFSFSPPAGQN